MPLPTSETELKAITNELLNQTDRGAAIIGASMLDDFLTEALKARLILSSRTSERLFSYEKNGPLLSFSAKIDMAFAVGILKPGDRDELHAIRKIRNHFAHKMEPITFGHPVIKGLALSLKSDLLMDGEEHTQDPRLRFLGSFNTQLTMLILISYTPIRLTAISPDDLEATLERIFATLPT